MGPAPVSSAQTTTSPDVYPLLSVEDLADLPEPGWLVDGLLAARGFNVLYGPSGGGKTFLALDWSLCIATGLAWYGRETDPGAVLYIAAEGTGGLHRRTHAWRTARAYWEHAPLGFLAQAVNLVDRPELDKARRTIDSMDVPPALIVVDTMARTMVGGDENAARDVGLFIDGVDTLRRNIDAAALVVHHTGKTGDDERGSSALRGAADLMAVLRPDGARHRLECTKAKDAEPFDPWTLHLSKVAESCVLELGSNRGALSAAERTILETLAAFGSDPAPAGKLLRASNVPERSFYRVLRSLLERGIINAEESGRSKLYTLTREGARALLPPAANRCQAADGTTAATPGSLGPGSGSDPGSERQAEYDRLTAKFSDSKPLTS